MDVPKEIEKSWGILEKRLLQPSRDLSPHLVFFSLAYFKSKQMYKDLKSISKVCLRNLSHMKLQNMYINETFVINWRTTK